MQASLGQWSVVHVTDAAPLHAHTCAVVSMTTASHALLLVSGDGSGRVIVWSIESGVT